MKKIYAKPATEITPCVTGQCLAATSPSGVAINPAGRDAIDYGGAGDPSSFSNKVVLWDDEEE